MFPIEDFAKAQMRLSGFDLVDHFSTMIDSFGFDHVQAFLFQRAAMIAPFSKRPATYQEHDHQSKQFTTS